MAQQCFKSVDNVIFDAELDADIRDNFIKKSEVFEFILGNNPGEKGKYLIKIKDDDNNISIVIDVVSSVYMDGFRFKSLWANYNSDRILAHSIIPQYYNSGT